MKYLLTLIMLLVAFQLAGQQDRMFKNINEIRQYSDSLEKSLNSSDKETSEGPLLELANAYLLQQMTPKSFAYAIKAKELAVKNRNDSSLMAANIILANLYSNSNMIAKADQTFEELIRSNQLKKDKNLYSSVLLSKAFNLNKQQQTEPAEQAFAVYVKEAEKNNDFEGLASAYFTKALSFYHQKRKFPQALEFYRKSLDVLTAQKDQIRNYNFLWHNCLNNIGDLYELQKDYNSALKYYLQALDFYNTGKIRNRESYCINIISVATIYNLQGKYSDAEELLQKGIVISDSMKNKSALFRVKSMLYNMLFANYRESGRQSEALKAVTAYQIYSDSLKSLELVYAGNSAVVNRLDNVDIDYLKSYLSMDKKQKILDVTTSSYKTLTPENFNASANSYDIGVLTNNGDEVYNLLPFITKDFESTSIIQYNVFFAN